MYILCAQKIEVELDPYKEYEIRISIGKGDGRDRIMTTRFEPESDPEVEDLTGTNYLKIRLELMQPACQMIKSKEIILVMKKDKVNFASF